MGTRGRTVHGEPANAGHRVLAPDDLEVETYLEQALHGPIGPERATRPGRAADDHRARLRRAVRAAHRAPHPRAERVLGAAPPRHAVGGDRGAPAGGDHPVRRAGIGLRPRRAAGRSAPVGGDDPGPGHLLRRPADGASAGWRGGAGRAMREYGPATIRAAAGEPLLAGLPAIAAGLDEPRRLDPRAAARVPRAGRQRVHAVRGHGQRPRA